MEERFETIVLLGPTGSGKTPLGQMLAARGYRERRCVHFDFGENLREIVARSQPDRSVSSDDIQFLRRVLETGALLEDKDFPIAQRILQSFLARCDADTTMTLVLNGLPRHAGQAVALAALLDMRTVILLNCSTETIYQRIAGNVGRDRAERTDDDRLMVQRKLQIFKERTAPLVDHFRENGAHIIRLDVTSETTVEDMWAAF